MTRAPGNRPPQPLRPLQPIRPPTRRSLLAGALLAGGALAACAGQQPPPSVSTGPELAQPTPAATPEQISTVLSEIAASLAAADEARDPALLAPRIVGSAAEFRTASYQIIAQVPEWASALDRPGPEPVITITSTATDFPRTALALVEDSGDSGVPFFMPLQQADARSPYATWGWAQQAVGVEMPHVADPGVGSEPVPADDESLRLNPANALDLYARVLTAGDGEDPDDHISPGPFQTETHAQLQQEREALSTGVEPEQAATLEEVYAVADGEYAGLRTDDGGAVVMATLTSTRTVDVQDGATLRYAQENVYTRLAGTREFTDQYVRQYGTTVALYIPTADSGAQIQPIGATRTLLGVQGQ